MLRTLDRLYANLLYALAALAGILILISIGLVVANVAARASGYGAFRFTIAVTEYILLYFTLLSAPYLVRIKGHVLIDMVISQVSVRARTIMETLVYLICISVCVIFAVISTLIMLEAIRRGTFDERSIDIPYWLLYALFPLSFGLMAIEFTRYLFRFDSLYTSSEKLEL